MGGGSHSAPSVLCGRFFRVRLPAENRPQPMLKPTLQLRLGQQLTMTPQLQQAIRLLQLPALELQQHVRETLESNVMLESVDDAGEATAVNEAPDVREEVRDGGSEEKPEQDFDDVDVEVIDDP